MKRALIAIVILSCLASVVHAADIQLPAPIKKGGVSALEAIDIRSSAGNQAFPSGQLSEQDLAVILWAASGRNRDGSKWTVPTGKWRPPYTHVFVTLPSGCYRYDWENNRLLQISETDARSIIPQQEFAKNAPLALYFIGNGDELAFFDDIPTWREEFPLVLAGAMSQNVYIAAEAIGVGARVVYSVRREAMAEHFALKPGDRPFFAMFLGKRQ